MRNKEEGDLPKRAAKTPLLVVNSRKARIAVVAGFALILALFFGLVFGVAGGPVLGIAAGFVVLAVAIVVFSGLVAGP